MNKIEKGMGQMNTMNTTMKNTAGMFCFSLLCLLALSPTARGQAGTASLPVNWDLLAGQNLTLPDGSRILSMQDDGNLVLYGRAVSRQLWQSGTGGHPGARYTMQGDGNLVVYDTNNVPLWASNTEGNPGAQLVMTNGNLVIYGPPKPVALWSSGTSNNPGASYTFQSDGNLVVYSADHAPLWASGTYGNPGATLFLDDGNLGILSGLQSNAVWASGTQNNPGAQLQFVNGTLNIVSTNGQVLWSEPFCPAQPWFDFWQFGDGSLQVWGPHDIYNNDPILLWSAGAPGNTNTSLVMQGDGNLVIYSVSHKVLWQTGTGGYTNSEVVMETNGNLVVWSGPISQVLWESHTAGNPGAQLVMQTNGNLVITGPTVRKPIWATGTAGNSPSNSGNYVEMRPDGNLVVYSENRVALWATGTGGQSPPNPHLDLQEDGNLVLYFQSGPNDPKWATGTCEPWMEKLGPTIGDFSLRKLVIPGSHDAGTWGLDDRDWANDHKVPEAIFWTDALLPWHVEIDTQWVEHHTSWWPHIPYWTLDITIVPHAKYLYSYARTQANDFSAQLNCGVRYFDMRVLYNNGGLYLIHTLIGPSIFNEIDEVNEFLRENPYEIVILDFQHFYDQDGTQAIPDAANRQLIAYLKSKLGDLLIPPPANVNQLTVNDIWTSGKQVVVFYDQAPPTGVDTSKFWSRPNQLRSTWFNQGSLYSGGGQPGLAQDLINEADCVANRQSDCAAATNQLWVLQGILTFDPGLLATYFASLEWSQLETWLNGNYGAANSVNGWVQNWALTSAYAPDVNVILGDWTELSGLASTAVAANLQKAGLNLLHPGIAGIPLLRNLPTSVPQSAATSNTVAVVLPPPDLLLDATDVQTPVQLGTGSAYDCIDGWVPSESIGAAASYPIGVSHVVWRGVDAAGVQGFATQTVWIAACKPRASKKTLNPAYHRMVNVTIKANVVPALRGKITLSATVQCSQSAQAVGSNARGSAWTKPRINQRTGTIQVGLKAEQSGSADRIYAITVTATDSQGHQSDAVVQVRVPVPPKKK